MSSCLTKPRRLETEEEWSQCNTPSTLSQRTRLRTCTRYYPSSPPRKESNIVQTRTRTPPHTTTSHEINHRQPRVRTVFSRYISSSNQQTVCRPHIQQKQEGQNNVLQQFAPTATFKNRFKKTHANARATPPKIFQNKTQVESTSNAQPPNTDPTAVEFSSKHHARHTTVSLIVI